MEGEKEEKKHEEGRMGESAFKARVERAMRESFANLIEKACSPPVSEEDAKWVSQLYEEMGQRLMSLTPRREDLHLRIEEALDPSLFTQMLAHDAIDTDDVRKVIQFVMGHLLLVCAPSQDASISRVRADLISRIDSGQTLGKVFPLLLNEVHSTCDEIDHLARPILAQMHAKGGVP